MEATTTHWSRATKPGGSAHHALIIKPGSVWLVSGESKDWPIQEGGRYLVEPVEEIGPRGIFAVAYLDGSIAFDRPQNLLRREGIKQVYQFTGQCMVDVE